MSGNMNTEKSVDNEKKAAIENNIFSNLSTIDEVEFHSVQDIKEITKSSLESWKEEYLFRLKRIFKNEIEECAKNGKYYYIHETASMDLHKARELREAILKQIEPMLEGYDLRCEVKNNNTAKSLATIVTIISWI